VERRFGAGPISSGNEAGEPKLAELGRTPLRSGARRRSGAPCGDFWLGTRFRDRL